MKSRSSRKGKGKNKKSDGNFSTSDENFVGDFYDYELDEMETSSNGYTVTRKAEKKLDDDEPTEKIDNNKLRKKSLKEKIFLPIKNFLSGLREDISPRYIASVAGGVLFCVFVVGMVLIFVEPSAPEPVKKPAPVVEDKNEQHYVQIRISKGMTTAEIADELADKGIIASSFKFRVLSRLHGYDDKMKSGIYFFEQGMADDDVFKKIMKGEKYLVTVTIPEGFGVRDIAERLYDLELVEKEEFLQAAEIFAPYDYMENKKGVIYATEGFLFPDTYSVENDATVEEILDLMVGEFNRRLSKDIREQAKAKGLSIYELVTLASLVEREVKFDEDRAIVAQILLKRLKMEIPLQTDATLQYLMDAPKEDVSIEDTKIDSPYNTYQNVGLPPGPIASPGMESIEAVLNPADTDYLYFVADRKGHNHYANTYEEHMELVNEYR